MRELTDAQKVEVLTKNLKCAEQLLRSYGWFPFGTNSEHADRVNYFSWSLSDESGMPYYERVYDDYIGLSRESLGE